MTLVARSSIYAVPLDKALISIVLATVAVLLLKLFKTINT